MNCFRREGIIGTTAVNGLLANLHGANKLTFQEVEVLDHSIQHYVPREITDHLMNAN